VQITILAGSVAEAARELGSARPGDVLDKHDFLRLLTVQLRYQDPINPVSDQDFIAQLAQFTALEQMQNLTDTIGAYVEVQRSLSASTQAASLLGRTVSVVDPETGDTVAGVVEAVRFDGPLPLIVVDGKAFTLGSVYEIRG
jgi:flagellar basal-body rod modification protein FlgD